MRGCRWLLLLGFAVSLAAAGCGGGGKGAAARASATSKGPPPASEVQEAMVAIIATCTKRSFDESVDTAPVSEQVDRMVSLFKAYDPDATLAKSDLRATTMRQALTQVRDQARTCSPQDEARLNDTLTSFPAPDNAQTAPTSEPEQTETPAGGGRGVATIAAELAPLCVAKISDPGPASPQIKALVDDLVKAYRQGPKNAATKHFMTVARSNLKDGCGPDQAANVAAALSAG